MSIRSAEGNRDNDDDADDDAAVKAADDGIDYATRILYHLRLCFDSEMIAISDASVAHKWLTAALVEVRTRQEIDCGVVIYFHLQRRHLRMA